MGMDVYGKNPTSERGTYFRQSIFGWHPLWDFCEVVAPAAVSKVVYAHSNDGDGLNADDSTTIAEALTTAIESGVAAAYCVEQQARLNALPDEPCRLCEGSGVRRDTAAANVMPDLTTIIDGVKGLSIHIHPRRAMPSPCNGCAGRGTVRPSATFYDTSVNEIAEFRDFLRDCGGFEIW